MVCLSTRGRDGSERGREANIETEKTDKQTKTGKLTEAPSGKQ